MDNVASNVHAQDFYGLVTKERAEKFDLLGQLILNQRETIILCGSDGIGKTRLLKSFKNAREAIWIICLLQGLESLHFEQIQNQLGLIIQHRHPELAESDLETLLSFCEQQQQKVVLMIDDAAYLAVGLITTLTEYALQNPALRIVFTFTREQLYQRSVTDQTVDDCYFMELPALTKPQAAVFVQNTCLFFNEKTDAHTINDKLLNKLYQRTAGIPGKIAIELPLLLRPERKREFSPSLKAALLTGIIAMSVASLLIYETSYDADFFNFQPVSDSLPLKPVKQNHQAAAKQNNKIVAPDNVKPSVSLGKTTKPQTNKQTIQQDADEQWILQQAAGKYTLQLMALSKRQALENIVKKHPNLQTALKILQIKNRNHETYILLYGSFSDTKSAYAVVNSLPAEFRQAWPRQIKSLQHEVRNRTVSLLKPNQLPLKQ